MTFIKRLKRQVNLKSYEEDEKASALLFISCWFVYIIVCMTKTNYTASMAYIVQEGIFSKSQAGAISAAFYLLYAVSQLLGGRVVDRLSPYFIISIGLVGSLITNLILIFTNQFWCVLLLWSFTGMIQFGVWPAAARIVTGVLIREHRKKASIYITLGVGLGGILSYLVVTPVLEGFGWCGVFIMNVILLFVSFLLWQITQRKTEKILITETVSEPKQKVMRKSDLKFTTLFFSSGLFLVMFFGIAQALLDNGVKSWVPTMMVEIYHLSPTWASIQTAFMYICNILGLFLLVRLFYRIKSPVLVQTLYFLICLPACILMLFIGTIPVWLVVVLLMISTTVTYAMTNIGVRIASAFSQFGYSGTVSGMINAFVCFGVVIGNGGYGVIAEYAGWNAVTFVWLIVCAMAVILGIPAVYLWKRKKFD